MTDLKDGLLREQIYWRSWLFDHALPLWWQAGGDHSHGGFHERLNLDKSPDAIDRRTRVAARQIYSYAMAKTMGYQGEIDEPIDQGFAWLKRARIGDGPYFARRLSPNGDIIDARPDLYDHAFILLALAHTIKQRPNDTHLMDQAVALRDSILSDFQNKNGSFADSLEPDPVLKANPHMHLFEACLAFMAISDDMAWRTLAHAIRHLCLSVFIDKDTGGLREFFDHDFKPLNSDEGRIIEPGHQFEWAWLLLQWAQLTGDHSHFDQIKRLIEIAETDGTDHSRNVSVNAIMDNFTPKDQKARLWPQTERLKAHLAWSQICEDPQGKLTSINAALKASQSLRGYVDTPITGMWRDQMDEDATFEVASSPASTLYHMVCAINELSIAFRHA